MAIIVNKNLDIKPERQRDIFSKIEAEIWGAISERLQCFFVRLSLVEHISHELLGTLLGDDSDLHEEFKQHGSFISFNKYIDAYLIQHLFHDFLCTKQHLLSDNDRQETYRAAACWSEQNGFLADALSYYEKLGDHQSRSAVEEKIKNRILNNQVA